MYGPKMLALF